VVGKNPGHAGTDLHFVVYNQEDRPAISQGYAFIKNV
jgi:hypothetical protein